MISWQLVNIQGLGLVFLVFFEMYLLELASKKSCHEVLVHNLHNTGSMVPLYYLWRIIKDTVIFEIAENMSQQSAPSYLFSPFVSYPSASPRCWDRSATAACGQRVPVPSNSACARASGEPEGLRQSLVLALGLSPQTNADLIRNWESHEFIQLRDKAN